jgi:hypothetical protein
VAVPGEESVEARVLGQECTLRVNPSGEELTVTREVGTNDCDEKCRAFLEDRGNMIARRKLDMKHLQDDIAAKQAGFEDDVNIDENQVGKELTELFAIRGNHKRELKELEGFGEKKISFKQTSKGETVVLPLGKLAQVRFFDHTVMYRKGPLVAEAVQVSEMVVSRTISLSAWQADHIVCEHVKTINYGPDDEPLNAPVCVTVSGNELFVGDDNGVSVYTLGGSFVRSFDVGTTGEPTAVAVDGEKLFVTIDKSHQVFVCSKNDGKLLRIIGRPGLEVADLSAPGSEERELRKLGGPGSGEGELSSPVGLAIGQNQLYVADADNNRVSVFALDGVFSKFIGEKGSGDGELKNPRGVAVSGGFLYVTDASHRVLVFRTDGSFVRAFGSKGSRDGRFNKPIGVAVAGDSVFVADAGNHRVSVHQSDGTFLRVFGEQGYGDGRFAFIMGIAVANGHVYVTDICSNSVQVFC